MALSLEPCGIASCGRRRNQRFECGTQKLKDVRSTGDKEAIHEMDMCTLPASLEPVVFCGRVGSEFVVEI